MNIRTKVESIGCSPVMQSLASNSALYRFDTMYHDPILKYVRREDLYALYQLATNPKYASSDMESRLEVYDDIMNPLGFTRAFSGTNRVVYSNNFDDTFLLKIGLDEIGISDNKSEFKNQKLLKPFVPKIFEVSVDGVVEMIERVHPIMSTEEFLKYAEQTFIITDYFITHGYALEDVGTDYFMNWGVRENFGPVLLDFPYIYIINNDRLRCTSFKDGARCRGELWYDAGYNHIKCSVCGKTYRAKDIGSSVDYLFKKKRKGVFKMDAPIRFTFTRGNKSVTHVVTDDGVDYIESPTPNNIVVNTDSRKYNDSIKKKETAKEIAKSKEKYFSKFSLAGAYYKTLEKIKTEHKLHNLSNDMIDYINNYIDLYHNKFILVPSTFLDKHVEFTDETKENIKADLSEQAGVPVNSITEISMGDYNMYIPSRPIINISKFAKCIESAVADYYEDEKDNTAVEPYDDGNKELADSINEITNDNSITFNHDSTAVNNTTPIVSIPVERTITIDNNNPLGQGVIDAKDAVVVPAKQIRYNMNDEF